MRGQGGSEFDQYLLTEYNNIAQAHFKTIDTLSTFFKHYLVIMSIPLVLLAFLFRVSTVENLAKSDMLPTLSQLLFLIFLAVALAGLGTMIYIINLRNDAILYARTINSIRKYFYDTKKDLDIGIKLSMRVLPQTYSQPPYRDWWYFGAVIFCFCAIDTLYFFFALTLKVFKNTSSPNLSLKSLPLWVYIAVLVFAFLHFLIYILWTKHWEIGYLKSYIIGVDIDGVLNKHQEQFCRIFKETTGRNLNPLDITHIPVHEDPKLGISREDEKTVFNNPRYWIDMPPMPEAAENLRKIRNSFNLKVYIFTHRDWPQLNQGRKEVDKTWKKEASLFSKSVELSLREKIRLFFKRKAIDRITILWLKKHGILYDKLIIEKGNEEIADPRGHFRNRFHISRKKKIRFFVEDDLRKAIKLAFICDVVFLLDQPYNRNMPELPSNIIRVKSWEDIYKEIRRLC